MLPPLACALCRVGLEGLRHFRYRGRMFERFVYLKLKDEWATDEGRALVMKESARVLPAIKEVVACRAGVPADAHAAKGWDMCLALQFASLADIETYRVHPDHQAFLEDFLAPKVEAKRVWNFEMQKLSSPT